MMRWSEVLGSMLVLSSLPAAAQAVDRPGSTRAAARPDIDTPRPIAAGDSLWIEKLTWMEVRDSLRAGKTTVIIPTGGVEQNGPYLVTGKHDVILRATAETIAAKLGNALVAPIVSFVPQGAIEPPAGEIFYPGTIGVEPATFEALLRDLGRSMKAQGFTTVVFIGDSGGNQAGMKKTAEALTRDWAGSGARALFIPEYYDWPGRQKWLANRGFHETDEGLHDELSAASIMLSVDPASIRMDERVAAGKFSINGIPLAPAERTAKLGRALVDHIAEVSVQAIRRAR